MSEWITTDQAAALTGYHPAHIRVLARTGTIEAVRAGRGWLVRRDSLLAHKAQMDAQGTAKYNPWRKNLGARGRRRDGE